MPSNFKYIPLCIGLSMLVGCFSNDRIAATPATIGVTGSASELAINDLLNAGVDDVNDAIDFSNTPRSVNNTGDAFDL